MYTRGTVVYECDIVGTHATTGDSEGPLAKGNLQTPQLYGYIRGVNMFEDSDEGF